MNVSSQLAALRHPWLHSSQLENLVFYSIICCFFLLLASHCSCLHLLPQSTFPQPFLPSLSLFLHSLYFLLSPLEWSLMTSLNFSPPSFSASCLPALPCSDLLSWLRPSKITSSAEQSAGLNYTPADSDEYVLNLLCLIPLPSFPHLYRSPFSFHTFISFHPFCLSPCLIVSYDIVLCCFHWLGSGVG